MPKTSQLPMHPRRRAAVAALAGALVAVLAPGVAAEARSHPARRACTAANAATYTVTAGAGWFSVARAAGVSMGALLSANAADASAALHPGDVLCLPGGAGSPPPPTPSSGCASKRTIVQGDSWFVIARSVGVSMNGLLQANGATAQTVLRPGAQICLPPGAAPAPAPTAAPTAAACASKHEVVRGESWYSISRSTGVPIDALTAANDAKPTSAIYPGQRLCLPEVGFGRELPSVPLDVAPVRGACRFANSWKASRGGGRLHVGVDLISPAGTPVVAVAGGTLTRRTQGGSLSGNAWWLTTPTGTYFFYAHLSSFASGLSVGSRVQAGDVIGYVGSTGNAVSPHLHFEIHPKGGDPVNPYSAIWMTGGCNYDKRYEQAPLS